MCSVFFACCAVCYLITNKAGHDENCTSVRYISDPSSPSMENNFIRLLHGRFIGQIHESHCISLIPEHESRDVDPMCTSTSVRIVPAPQNALPSPSPSDLLHHVLRSASSSQCLFLQDTTSFLDKISLSSNKLFDPVQQAFNNKLIHPELVIPHKVLSDGFSAEGDDQVHHLP